MGLDARDMGCPWCTWCSRAESTVLARCRYVVDGRGSRGSRAESIGQACCKCIGEVQVEQYKLPACIASLAADAAACCLLPSRCLLPRMFRRMPHGETFWS